MARSSYIHPSVIEAYEAGSALLRGRMRKGLSRIEGALTRFREASLTGCRHRVEKGREEQKIKTLEVSFP